LSLPFRQQNPRHFVRPTVILRGGGRCSESSAQNRLVALLRFIPCPAGHLSAPLYKID
jgi:hypothetical protein